MLLRPPLARTTAPRFLSARPTHQHAPGLLSRRRRPGLSNSYGLPNLKVCPRRHFHIPNYLLPPVIFTGLLVALYIWKSFVMVSLQNKIIYAPYLPPTARFETISDWQKKLSGIEWRELHMRSLDGTDLALAVASVSSGVGEGTHDGVSHHVYILYLQGNASSLPPRLPDHSWILKRVQREFKDLHPECGKVRFTQVGLSYRGYWTSAGRPTEIGINQDAVAAMQWISQLHDNTYDSKEEDGQHEVKPIFFIWGQSIGAGFATNLAASGVIPAHLEPSALILETPFLSIKEMLETIYPEKWLPYKYLHPFIRNHLDSYKNLGMIADQRRERGTRPPQIFILEAGRDEVVPPRHAEELRRRCEELRLPMETKLVPKAFHSDAMIGRVYVADFIVKHTAKVIGDDYQHKILGRDLDSTEIRVATRY